MLHIDYILWCVLLDCRSSCEQGARACFCFHLLYQLENKCTIYIFHGLIMLAWLKVSMISCHSTVFLRKPIIPHDSYRVFCCHRPHPPPQSSVGRLTVPSAPTPRSIHFLSIQPTRVVMMSCCIEVAFLKGSNSNLLIPRLLAAPTPLIRSVWLYWQMLASPQYKLL